MPSSDQQLATIVVIDDEPGIVDFVELGLRHEGFAVLSAGTVAAGLDLVRREHPDLAIVDVGLPDGDGFELLRRLRAESDVPVVMLTARGDLDDRVRGLELVAEDYVAKPFHMAELLARVRAHLRRQGKAPAAETTLRFADLQLDTGTRRVSRAGREVELTARRGIARGIRDGGTPRCADRVAPDVAYATARENESSRRSRRGNRRLARSGKPGGPIPTGHRASGRPGLTGSSTGACFRNGDQPQARAHPPPA